MREGGYQLGRVEGITESSSNLEKIQNVELPEKIESELKADVLPRFLDIAERAGVTPEEIERFKACYDEFANRPSEAGLTDEFLFRPNTSYFGTEIAFKDTFEPMPDVLQGTNFKLRPMRSGETVQVPTTKTIDTSALNDQFVAVVEKGKRGDVTEYEKFLVQMNRLVYRIHESLHIYQNLTVGEQVNKLKDNHDAAGVINPEKEKALVAQRDFTRIENWPTPDWISESSLLGPVTRKKDDKPEQLAADLQLANNEATMDIISEWLVKSELEKYPDLQLWLHNTMVHLAAKIESIRDNLFDSIAKKDFSLKADYNQDQLFHALDLVQNAYFAIFDNPAQSSAALSKMEFKVGNQPAQATIAEGANFDRLALANYKNEVKYLIDKLSQLEKLKEQKFDKDAQDLEKKLVRKVTDLQKFPSGNEFIKDSKAKPISMEGATLAADIAAKLAGQELNALDINNFFTKLDESLKGSQEDREHFIEAAKFVYHIDLTEDQMREMRNISQHYIIAGLAGKYSVQMPLRKLVLEKIKDVRPEDYNRMIQWTFFEAPIAFREKQFYMLTGFAEEQKDANGNITYKGDWDEISKNTSLGLFDIDMTKLSQEDIDTIKTMYNVGYKISDQEKGIGELIEIAKRQKGKE